MKTPKKLLNIAFTIGIGLTGIIGCGKDSSEICKPKDKYFTVKEEFGTFTQLVKSKGALFANDSVKFNDSNYGLVLEDENKKEYIVEVVKQYNEDVSLTALEKAIKSGTKIKIKNIKKTMCHHTLKCVVCYRHLFLGCSEIEYKQYTTS